MDTAKCTDNKCPSRVNCYRYRGIGNPTRQAFADFKHDPKKGKCEFFFDTTGFHNTQLLTVKDADNIIARMKS